MGAPNPIPSVYIQTLLSIKERSANPSRYMDTAVGMEVMALARIHYASAIKKFGDSSEGIIHAVSWLGFDAPEITALDAMRLIAIIRKGEKNAVP